MPRFESLPSVLFNSGQVVNFTRASIPDHIIDELRPLVRAGGGLIPQFAPWWFEVAVGEDCAIYSIFRGREPAVFCVVAWSEHGADLAWEILLNHHRTADRIFFEAGVDNLPAEVAMPEVLPWHAVLMLPGGVFRTAASDRHWMMDFGRCSAFAFLEEASAE